MNRHTIRTNETDSVRGLPSKQKIKINLKQTTKSLPFSNVSTTLSQRTQYEEERQAGNKFRLILTIVPYCTNVLFNPLTEIIKDEGNDGGSEKTKVITDLTNSDKTNTSETHTIKANVYGLKQPQRYQMIADTEYSSELHGGYEYHPGYDFFDNHILRNKTFKVVNTPNTTNDENFNTLSDYVRDRNGNVQKFVKRKSIDDINSKQKFDTNKHLYMKDDILTIDDSINQNLTEDNGWWGFVNNTVIDAKAQNRTTKKWESLDISRVLNNHKSCEFIDMYPDRTLFSFSPKYNSFTQKNENNWNVVITYPYKNDYTHPLCFGGDSYIRKRMNSEGEYSYETISEGNKWMGLKVMDMRISVGGVAKNNLVFRTYTKHGLSQGDAFYVYYTNPYFTTSDEKYGDNKKFSDDSLNGKETYYESETFFTVTNVGDLNRNDDEYYFYTSNLSLLDEIYKSYLAYANDLIKGCSGTETDPKDVVPFYELYEKDDKKGIYNSNNELKSALLNKLLKYTNFRIRHFVNGVKSTYYLRIMRKIPNLRSARREMTEEEKLHKSKFNGVFEQYITENALDPVNPQHQRLINNEQYQMAFASNIYNDNVSQISFMDGIDVEGLTDNLGRPLSKIYYTFVKNNAGHEAWYGEDEEFPQPVYNTSDLNNSFLTKYGKDYTIEYSHCFGKVTSGLDLHFRRNDTESLIGPAEYLKKLSSARHISNVISQRGMSTMGEEEWDIKKDDISRPLDSDINYKDTFFYGDLVEFNAIDFEEKVLSNVMHRFNTAQRELINNKRYSQYQYHEIDQDDYDPNDFHVGMYSAVDGMTDENLKTDDYPAITRPEGYIYQAHYPIRIREFTQSIQNSNYTMRVRNAKPVQRGNILIQVQTALSHKLSENDIIYICDDATDTRYVTKCVSVVSPTIFLMSPHYTEILTNATDFEDRDSINNVILKKTNEGSTAMTYKHKFSWLELCDILNGKYDDDINYPRLILRRKNKDIPDYATYIGGNQYIWKKIVNIGDSLAQNIPDYIFANGYFYITQSVNFYLKRQDPFGTNKLYFDGEDIYPFFPNDPSGSLQPENNFVTKETATQC